MDKFTVFHINTERTYRGGEVQTLLLSKQLQRNGHSNVIFTQKNSMLATKAREEAIQTVELTMRGEWDTFAAQKIRKAIRHNRPAIMHAHTPHACALAILARGRSSSPVIVFSRRISSPLRRTAKYKQVDALMGFSNVQPIELESANFAIHEMSIADHGVNVLHAWGMTEMTPVGTLSGSPGQEQGLSGAAAYDKRALQGPPIPFVEIRVRGAEGFVSWDGKTMGELEVRGPSVSSSYYDSPESADRWTDDGWFRTGDIVTIHPDGYVEVQDRAKDLVKSGGEWISTVALENALMGHPAVAEAAVIAVPDEKWSERPLAVVVLKEDTVATDDELREFLAPGFAKWWLPDRFEFVEEIPKTAVGKFRKTALREQFSAGLVASDQPG